MNFEINCIIPNLNRRPDRWHMCYQKLLNKGFPPESISRHTCHDGRHYITTKNALNHARRQLNGKLPHYLSPHNSDPFDYTWKWSWYDLLTKIAQNQNENIYTLFLFDDYELRITYDELCQYINTLRDEPEGIDIIQLAIPPSYTNYRRQKTPVPGCPDFQYGLAGRADAALILSPQGAKQMLHHANEFIPKDTGTPAGVAEFMSDNYNTPGWFAVSPNSELGQSSTWGAVQPFKCTQDRTGNHSLHRRARTLWNEFIQDKTVAIVGRGSYLAYIEQGELIDSHDTVIRLHNPLPHPQANRDMIIESDNNSFVPIECQERLGTRTSIFALDLAHCGHIDVRRVIKCFRDNGGELCVTHKFYNVNGAIQQIDIIQDEFLPVHFASMENFVSLSRQLDYAFPLSGTLLIYEVLHSDPKSVYYTGFSCFQDETRLGKQAEARLAGNYHPLLDLRFLRAITTVNDHITTDDFTMQLFDREKEL